MDRLLFTSGGDLRQSRAGRITSLRLLLQALQTDGFHVFRDTMVQLAGAVGSSDKTALPDSLVAVEGQCACEHFEEDHPQRIDVSTPVRHMTLACCLLRDM